LVLVALVYEQFKLSSFQVFIAKKCRNYFSPRKTNAWRKGFRKWDIQRKENNALKDLRRANEFARTQTTGEGWTFALQLTQPPLPLKLLKSDAFMGEHEGVFFGGVGEETLNFGAQFAKTFLNCSALFTEQFKILSNIINLSNIIKNICMDVLKEREKLSKSISILLLNYFHVVFILK